MFGKLSLSAFPHEPIQAGGAVSIILAMLAVIVALTYLKRWTWLWKEWITTTDHKKIGIMYVIAALIMLLRGFGDAIMMRAQLALSAGANHGFLSPDHYNQIFTAHGVIMIFFMAMPLMFGLFNLVIPLQIGARDVAYPFLNSLSFWLFVMGAMLVNFSLIVGEFAAVGWLAYPPLSEVNYSPGVGVDYYIWALQISGVGSLISGINFFVTIIKMRCPGMTLMKMPVFIWSALCTNILVMMVFPVLTVTLSLLFLDRYFGFHFFTSDLGGNAMMYINMIWIWGHPEVYILVLPAFGIFSEIASTFAQKKLFGYKSMVWAIAVITILSMIVWAHHFFTMGAGGNVNAVFGITTMIISVPTGVKIFNWLFTLFRGRLIFKTPLLWLVGFLLTFTLGGMTGVMLSVPAADFQFHNSMFLVAHFHNTIIGGVVFGYFAGFIYWFPKVMGFKLDERLGKAAFAHWIVGFFVTFTPLYILGLMGMTRRLSHYDASTGWQSLLVVSLVGALIIGGGVACQLVQIAYSFWKRKELVDHTGDPWNGRTLEWSLPSPPPFYNFARIPTVTSRDDFWEQKNNPDHPGHKKIVYEDIHMPKNSGLGFMISVAVFVCGFGLVWHITWLIGLGLLALFMFIFMRSFDEHTDYYVPAEEVLRIENQLLKRKGEC
ncbi:MAG: cytochrome o ubiquinol oxidase subunit I [Oligoflexia bacterium]|nr:cytochrome o ubiquinol oxidase subunit I [Oligoflexia bacterium]MBF0366384.1 cytochrome o ubiquinol oxidase subunit I [Oligoflexia bacterium]